MQAFQFLITLFILLFFSSSQALAVVYEITPICEMDRSKPKKYPAAIYNILDQADLYFQNNQFGKAHQVLGPILQHNKNIESLWQGEICALAGMKKNKKAYQLVEEGLSLFPDNQGIVQLKLMILINTQKWDAAVTYGAEATKQFPKDELIYYFYGVALSQQKTDP